MEDCPKADRIRWSVTVPLLFLTATLAAAQASADGVVWNAVVNATAIGSSLTKTSDCDGCQDAGAISVQAITLDNGYVELTVSDTTRYRAFGLGHGNSSTGLADIDFAVLFTPWVDVLSGMPYAEVRENGVWVAWTTYQTGDVLRVAIVNGQAQYSKNGSVFYAHLAIPIYPLRVAAALLTNGATLDNIVVSAASAPSTLPACAGLLDDALAHLPLDYEPQLPPPPRGVPLDGVYYRDATLGCSILRLSDAVGQGAEGGTVHHEYSSMSPFNRDNTRLLLSTCCAFFMTDLTGRVVVSDRDLGINLSQAPRWSTTNPSVLYYYEGSAIKRYDWATNTRATVADLSALYASVTSGGGEDDISEDGLHLVITGTQTDGRVFEQVLEWDPLHPSDPPALRPGRLEITSQGLDWCDLTPNNNVLCMWFAEGTGRFQGVELFDKDMNFQRQVLSFVGHSDRARDVNGDEVLIVLASNAPWPRDPAQGDCAGNGVLKVRLSDSQKTCLLNLYWAESTHLSVNNSGGHPWVLVSNTDADSDNYFRPVLTSQMPPVDEYWLNNWQSDWGTYFNELTLVRLDGTEVRRLAHHRSRLPSANAYWFAPRAAISRDGSYLVFDSNLSNPSIDYTDAYLIKLR